MTTKKRIILAIVVFLGLVTVVSAEVLIASDEVSFSSSHTSASTVKGALDELFTVPTSCPVGYNCVRLPLGTETIKAKAAVNTAGTSYSSSSAKSEAFIFNHAANETEQIPQAHTDYRFVGGKHCIYNNDENVTARFNVDGTCPVIYDYVQTEISTGEITSYTNRYKCPANTSYYTYECTSKNASGVSGTNPNNYIDFNNETWRIIGVFTVDDGTGHFEDRIKIVRDEQLAEKKAFDRTSHNKYENGEIDLFLNEDSVGNYYYSLTNEAKQQLGDAVFYFGTKSGNDYVQERSATGYSTYPINLTRKLSLVYFSDFNYTLDAGVDSLCSNGVHAECYNHSTRLGKSWMQVREVTYTITLSGSGASFLSPISNSSGGSTHGQDPVLPTGYLKASVVLSGTGAENDHYKIVAW